MIDWALVFFPIVHEPLASGTLISLDSNGAEEWHCNKRSLATGSYEKRISLTSVGGDGFHNATELKVNGNPSKFLQGHNVFGSDDLKSLLYDTFCVLVKQYDLHPTDMEIQRIKNGCYPIKTIDINYSFDLLSRSDVLAYIRALEFKAKTRHGRPAMKGGTLYFGKHSHRWALKAYCKAEEIETKNGKIPHELQGKGIEDWSENKLRIELRLLSKELDELGIKEVKDLDKQTIKKLFNIYLRKIDMNDQIKLNNETFHKLPKTLRATYTLWVSGSDLRDMISKATYYRHRTALKEYGINIDLDAESGSKSNVVPMIRILEAVPAENPQFAFDKGLIHHSA